MKTGARFYGHDSSVLIAKARVAEELGYESIWRRDHLILPVHVASDYPYSSGPGRRFDADNPAVGCRGHTRFPARLVLECGAFSDAEGRGDLEELERFANRIEGRWR